MKRKHIKKSSSFFRTQLRRDILAVGGAFLFFLIVFLIHLVTVVPTRPHVETMFNSPSYTKVLAYEIWNGRPYMLFKNGGSVHFDRLILDPFSFSLPPLPRWQWSGDWYSIPATNRKVSVAIGYCTGERLKLPPQCQDLDVFGQINDKRIIAIELKFQKNGKWEHYQVAYPGFAIRIPNVTSVPVDYRFLDSYGKVVVSKDPLIPLEKPEY